MLAQKVALETFEAEALTIPNKFPPHPLTIAISGLVSETPCLFRILPRRENDLARTKVQFGGLALTTADTDNRANSGDDANGGANIRILRKRTSAGSIDNRNRAYTHSTHSEAGSSRRNNTGDGDRCRPG